MWVEKYSIETERMSHVPHGFGFRQVDDAYQRMLSLYAQHIVILRDGVDI